MFERLYNITEAHPWLFWQVVAVGFVIEWLTDPFKMRHRRKK